MDDLTALMMPFYPSQTSWRVGQKNKAGDKATALAYLDARDVMNRLDSVLGTERWQCEEFKQEGVTFCRLGVRFGDTWVWKTNAAGDTRVEGEKGGASDAFKRAAVLFGVGRYLYDLGVVWQPVGKYGFEKDVLLSLQSALPNPADYEALYNWYVAQLLFLGGLDNDKRTELRKDNTFTGKLKRLRDAFPHLHADMLKKIKGE